MTRLEANVYLAGLTTFYGFLVCGILVTHQMRVHLQGSSGWLLLLPFFGFLAIYWVGHRVAERSAGSFSQQPFVIVWGLTGFVLSLGLGIPSAIAALSGDGP